MAWNTFYIAAGAAKILCLPFLPLRGTEGGRHIPDSPCIIAANRSSAFDAALLALAHAEAKKTPLHILADEHCSLQWFLRRGGSIPPGDLKTALGWLAAKGPVGIFPEGKVNAAPVPEHPPPAAALLALESGVPVVPAAIIGSDRAFPRGKRLPVFGRRVRVCFGRPVPLMEKERRYASLPRDERANLISNVGYRIMRAIGELAGRECGE